MDPAIDLTLRTAFALLFVVAAVHKLRDLPRFRATVAEYRLVPRATAALAAAIVVAVEAAVAVALVVPALRAAGLVTAAAVLLVYAAAIGVNLVRGRRDLDCGCAGPALRRPISEALVARNAVLAGAALAGLAPVHARPLLWLDGMTVAAATAALAALYGAVDRMTANAPGLARLRVRT